MVTTLLLAKIGIVIMAGVVCSALGNELPSASDTAATALALLSLMSALGVGIFRECYSLSKQRCPYSWLRAARDCQEVHPQTPIPASRNPLSLPGMSSKYHRIPGEERLFSRGGTQTFHVSGTGSSTISKTMFIQLISSDPTSLPDALSLNPDP